MLPNRGLSHRKCPEMWNSVKTAASLYSVQIRIPLGPWGHTPGLKSGLCHWPAECLWVKLCNIYVPQCPSSSLNLSIKWDNPVKSLALHLAAQSKHLINLSTPTGHRLYCFRGPSFPTVFANAYLNRNGNLCWMAWKFMPLFQRKHFPVNVCTCKTQVSSRMKSDTSVRTRVVSSESLPLLLAVKTLVPVLSHLHSDCLNHFLHVFAFKFFQLIHF